MSALARVLPVTVFVMAIPLLFGLQIKGGQIPHGAPFVILWSWAMVSNLVVPFLLATEFFVCVWLWRRRAHRGLLAWNLSGVAVGTVAELIVFLALITPTEP